MFFSLAVWAGGVFFFLLLRPGACLFFAVWAGDGSSLTYPSAWLVFKRPNNNRDRTAKKNTGSYIYVYIYMYMYIYIYVFA